MFLEARINEITREVRWDRLSVAAVNGDYAVGGFRFGCMGLDQRFNLTTGRWYVIFTDVKGQSHSNPLPSADASGIVEWSFDDNVTKQGPGVVKFFVKVVKATSGGVVSKSWRSNPASIRVNSSIDYNNDEEEAVRESEIDRLAGLVTELTSKAASIGDVERLLETITGSSPQPVATVSDLDTADPTKLYLVAADGRIYYYLNNQWNPGPVYGSYSLDSTLTQSGQAADAKAVGDRIAVVEDDISSLDDRVEELESGGVVVDETLTQSGMAADAKTVGDVLYNGYEKEKMSGIAIDSWILSSNISANGVVTINNANNKSSAISSNYFNYKTGTVLRNVGAVKDANDILLTTWVCEYNASNSFLRRNYVALSSDLVLGENCSKVRFMFSRNSSTGITMTQSDIDTYFGVAVVSTEQKPGICTEIDTISDKTDKLSIDVDVLKDSENRLSDLEEALGRTETIIGGNQPIAPTSWVLAAVIDSSGNYSQGSTNKTSAVATEYFPATEAVFIRTKDETTSYGNNFVIWVHEYDSNNAWLRRTAFGGINSTIAVGNDCAFVRFHCNYPSSTGITMTMADINVWFGVSQIVDEAEEEIKQVSFERITSIEDSIQSNVMKDYIRRIQRRAKLITDIQWTPIAPVPKRYYVNGQETTGSFEAGVPVKGIPYANQLRYELWAGRSVTFETFLSALKNPNSVMYDFSRKNDSSLYRPGAWYSLVCSKAVLFTLGIDANYASGKIADDEDVSLKSPAGEYTAEDIEIGDIIEKTGVHSAIVTDKIYSTFGRLVQIEVSEATTPSCRRKRWNLEGNLDNFWTHFDGYYLLKYSKLESIQDVDDETLTPYISSTLGMNFGNRANYMTEDVTKVTILHKISNSLIVTLNGTVIDTMDVTDQTDGDEIAVSSVTPGFYSINFDGGEAKDTVEFLRDDSTCSFSNGVLTFSSTYGKLLRVAFAEANYRAHIGTDTTVTDAHRQAGRISLTKPSRASFIHAFFETAYGVLCREVTC